MAGQRRGKRSVFHYEEFTFTVQKQPGTSGYSVLVQRTTGYKVREVEMFVPSTQASTATEAYKIALQRVIETGLLNGVDIRRRR